jgi:signal transduction histidine kinase/PleD family two-component response regulator
MSHPTMTGADAGPGIVETDPANTRVNILLVDDQPGNLLALEAILEVLGQNLVRARSGPEALKRLLEKDFAVILLDVHMPGMDGLETAALIRQRDKTRHTPIIFLTAHERTDAETFRGYSLGAVDYLFKPLVPEVLRSKVAVFVELTRKTEQIKLQAELLRQTQQREHERKLAEEKQRWEMERLREEAAKEKRIAEVLTQTMAERVRAEEELSALKDELAARLADMVRLYDLSARLSNTLELQAILRQVLTAVTALHGTDMGLVLLYDRDRGDLLPVASTGLGDDHIRQIGRIPPGAGSAGAALLQRRPVIVEDVAADPLCAPYRDAARQEGYRATCSTPLLTRGGDVIGVIAAYFRQPHRPPENQFRLVELYTRQAAEALDNARLYQENREANRRKDEFLAMLAHELRNPLAPILNALHILRLSGTDSEDAEKARETAERQVRHMVRLVDDLLDVSRITRGKIELRKEPVELAGVVARAVESSRPLLDGRSHRLEVSAVPEGVWVEADPTRLEQILANLLNNAAKYTEPGGRIWLTARQDNGAVEVRVKDTGIGLAPDMLPRVFEPFVQVDQSLERAQGGLGIGLTLVRSLVEMHGGTVQAQSAGLGQGSEFVVRLPVLAPSAAAAARPVAATEPSPVRPLRVLLVDDHKDSAESLATVLRLQGQEVNLAHDGPSALAAAQAFRPEVVLLDIGLPGMDGYQVAQRLRERTDFQEIMLIALTGYGQEEDRRRSLAAGFNYHLVKPVDHELLGQILRDHAAACEAKR